MPQTTPDESTGVTNPTSEVTSFGYDNNSNITSITDPRDKVTTLAYNNLNRLTTITDANNHATTVDYNSNGAITKVTNAQNKYTEFSYDNLNRMWKVKNALGDEWTRSWNDAGKLVSLDAPNTAAQAFVYNIDGLMTNSTDSNAKDQTYEYNLNGNITSVTDPLGNESTFNYDTLNRLTRAYDPQGNYIENTYDAVGNVTAFRDRRGNSWSYTYDDIYRLASMTDPLSNVTNYVYNDNSKVTQVQKPPQANPPTVNFGYDNASRVNSFTDELNHSASITYTNGLVSSVTDRKSQQFGFSYDDVGLLTQISMPGSQNITFDYDSLNRLTSFTDLVGTTEFTYDDIGRLSTTTDPYSFTHELEYNSESMITSLTAGTDARTYTWDTSGRMTEATRNSQTTSYTYNDASWVTKIDYPNSTNTNYSYNNRGWMTGIELKDSSNNSIFALPYTYDANGNVTEESVGNDTISYTYDALNRLTFIDRPGTTNDTTYTYDERGNRTEMETNSITNYLTFNAADELTRVDKPSNAYDTYTYDNNGNCTQMDRYYPQPLLASRTDNNPTTNYNANSSSSTNTENNNTNPNKLLKTHYPADYAPYPINKWHNLSPYLPDVSQIDPISAKIASMIPQKAEYDRERRWRQIAMPQTNPDESTSFTYSSDNSLTHVDLTNGDDLDFAYDGAGRRLEKKYTTVDSGTTYETKYTYHYIGSQITTIDIDGKSISGETETVTKDDQIRIHLGANTRPISFEYYTKNINTEQTTSATYYYHYDLHGNVILVTDSSGTTQITYTYDQLGTVVSETNTNSIYNPFTYMGEAQIMQDSEFDTSNASPKTGLYNSGSGYYNPETGTSLGGSGAPAMTNPLSMSAEEPAAQETKPANQLAGGAAIAAVAGGIPSSSADVMPEAPYSGLAQPSPASTPTTTNSLDNYLCVDDSSGFDQWDQLESLSGPASITDWYTKWLKKHKKTPSNCSIGYANCGSDNGGRKGGMGNDVDPGGIGGNKKPWEQPGWCADDCAKVSNAQILATIAAGDQDATDDNTQYAWVIRQPPTEEDKKDGKAGKIIACQPRFENPIVFPVDGDGRRTSDTPCDNMGDLVDNWRRIIFAIDHSLNKDGFSTNNQEGTGKIFDENGNPLGFSVKIFNQISDENGNWTGSEATNGSIAFNMGAIGGNYWSGLFIQSDGRIARRSGHADDFGYNGTENRREPAKKGSCLTNYYDSNTNLWNPNLIFSDGILWAGVIGDCYSTSNPPKHWIIGKNKWEYIP